MREIKFSVVLPVYNVEPYLKECLDSICASKENLEIIAVDDGSTDGSLKLLQNYPDARLKIFHKENEGVFKTWQYGVRQSTGDYIVFVDPDDYIDPKLFDEMKDILSERDYDMIMYQHYNLLDGKIASEEKNVFIDKEVGAFEGEALQKYLDVHLRNPKDLHNFYPVLRWGKVIRAQLLKDFLPNLLSCRIDLFEDDSFSLPFATTLKSLYITQNVYYYYRKGRKGSICTSAKLRKKWQDCQTVVDYIEHYGGGSVFSEDGRDFYFMRSYFMVFLEVIEKKDYDLAKEIYSSPRFHEKVKDVGGLKGYLWRHGKFGIFRFIRMIKLKLKGV